MHFVWSLEMHRPLFRINYLLVFDISGSFLVSLFLGFFLVFQKFWSVQEEIPFWNQKAHRSIATRLSLSWSKVLSFVSKMTFKRKQLETYKMARKFDTCLVAMKFNLRTLHKLLFLLTTTNFNDCGNTQYFHICSKVYFQSPKIVFFQYFLNFRAKMVFFSIFEFSRFARIFVVKWDWVSDFKTLGSNISSTLQNQR